MLRNLSNLYKCRISSYSFRGNYSFLNLEIQRLQYINVRKLCKRRNYSRMETMWGNMVLSETAPLLQSSAPQTIENYSFLWAEVHIVYQKHCQVFTQTHPLMTKLFIANISYFLIYFPQKLFFFEFRNCRKFKYLHRVRGQSGFFDLVLTERNMQIKFDLRLSVYLLGVD